MPLPGPLSQQKRYEMLYGTQTRRDNLLFTSMISLYYQWLEVEGTFAFDNVNLLHLWPN